MAVRSEILPERYRDATRVARGGMGEVFRALDTVLGRPVALKLLAERYAANDEIRKRFTREALAAARLSAEPTIVTIYDVGESAGRPFIVMQYLAGGSLEDVVKRGGGQPPKRALAWLEAAARALDYAHRHGIVHRDVKPANILLDGEGGAHVADFGIASAAGLDSLTQTGTILGTVGYFAPEQAEGRTAGPAADRYALGVVGFELLTGRRPFESDSATAEAAAHVNAPVPAISSRGHSVPAQADAVFLRALAKQPAARFPSCAEFVAALRDAYFATAGTTRVVAPQPTTVAPAPRKGRRFRVPLAVGLVALALGGGAIAGAVIAGGSEHRATKPTAPVTITERGTTLRETVTAQPPPTTAAHPTSTPTTAAHPTSTPTTASTSSASGSSLALAGYSRLQANDAAGALPLLQQAAQKLQETGSLTEAYNDYNLAFALAKMKGCSTQVLQLLDASQAIQGHRKEIDRLRKTCRGRPGKSGE
jgi:eukaryotic-like serine/threonine-protein kinase